jgi:hypothetical protein
MAQRSLTIEGATAVYALLRLVGAPARDQDNFVHVFTTEARVPSEWRFQGEFGFGGKLWLEHDRWRVSCYREDDTPERIEKIELLNLLLEVLRLNFGDPLELPEFQRLAGRLHRQGQG